VRTLQFNKAWVNKFLHCANSVKHVKQKSQITCKLVNEIFCLLLYLLALFRLKQRSIHFAIQYRKFFSLYKVLYRLQQVKQRSIQFVIQYKFVGNNHQMEIDSRLGCFLFFIFYAFHFPIKMD